MPAMLHHETETTNGNRRNRLEDKIIPPFTVQITHSRPRITAITA